MREGESNGARHFTYAFNGWDGIRDVGLRGGGKVRRGGCRLPLEMFVDV